MLERGAQAALAVGDVAGRGREKVQGAADLAGDLRGRTRPNRRGRQLDPQRQSLHQLADADDCGLVIGREGEAPVGPPRAGEEEGEGVVG